jgi:branched-chain amino acid transport system substrate-binding protein
MDLTMCYPNPAPIIVLWIIFFLAGCGPAGPPPEAQKTFKIGVIYPFTGPDAATGQDLKSGVELAKDFVNQVVELPITLPREMRLPAQSNVELVVIFKDSRNNPTLVAKLVEELVTQERVAAIMGCYHSPVTAAASEQAEIMKIPFLNPDSTSPMLIQRGLQWFFRTTPDDETFSQNFFTFLEELPARIRQAVPKRLVLVYENRLWGTSVAGAERKLASKHGYQIVEEVPYEASGTQFDEEVLRIKRCLPSFIFQASYGRDAILFMQRYKFHQVDPLAILAMNAGFISPEFSRTLGPDSEYIFSREVWALDISAQRPIVAAVNKLFSNKFGRHMTGNSARAFTGIMVLTDALNRAATLEPKEVREALLNTNLPADHLIMPWEGVKFDPKTGQNILGKGIIVQMQAGKYCTVWPWDLASCSVKWPIPAWSRRARK